jgi:DnaJ like chaperone protein
MGMWQWVGEAAESGVGAVGALFAWAGSWLPGIGDPAKRREAAFSVARIALSAKMAKADGVVTRDEVAAFRRQFSVPPGEERHVQRLFDLARQDTAGYDSYARRVAALYASDPAALENVLDGLFVVAKADGAVHEAEFAYLESVATIFGMDGTAFERIASRHVVPEEGDPWLVLGAGRDWSFRDVRAQYLKLVTENHPDRVIARGLPTE